MKLFIIKSTGIALTLLALFTGKASAYDFEADGIYYTITDRKNLTAAVSNGINKYIGDVTIPANVVANDQTYTITSIAAQAFLNCDQLKSITIGSEVRTIDRQAFKGCTDLSELIIPDNVVSFTGDSYQVAETFMGCTGLTKLTIGRKVAVMGAKMFYGCTNLKEVIVKEGVPLIGKACFSGCSQLESINIPETVTAIGDEAFMGTKLKTLNLLENVQTIGVNAFNSCKSLVTVTLGDGVTEIGGQAFMNCDHLESITFDTSLRAIGYKAFYGCIALSKIEIPDMVTALTGDMYDFGQTFMGCINLTEVVLGAGITTMAKEIFRNCRKLQKVTIKEGTTLISESCFLNCDNLQTLSFPNSVKSIGNNACEGCSSLKQVVIGNGVTTIGSSAFKNCTHLETIHLGTDVKAIGFDAFKGCKALEEIVIPDNVETFGQAMYGESETFVGCTSLKKATLGKNVAAMGKGVFAGCTSLETLIIKDGVSYIGNTMFYSCNRMKNIQMKCTVIPKTDGAAFSDYDATLSVPKDMLEEYKAHAVLGRFGEIVALPDDEPKDFVSLSVRQADNGIVKIEIPNGESYTFTIVPEEGWTVHSVTFNDEDVTDLLVDNTYTTPAITADCVLNVAFEQELNSINTIEKSRTKVTSDRNGNIVLSNLFPGETVTVYDVNGIAVCEQATGADHMRIHIGRHGTFIVKTKSKTIKIRL